MPFQLVISKSGQTAAESLQRKRVLTFDATETTLGDDTASCPLEGAEGIVAAICATPKGAYVLDVRKDGCVAVNGKMASVGASIVLRSGDRMTIAGNMLQFYRLMPKVAQSWRSSLVARVSQVVILLIVVNVVIMMMYLPFFASKADSSHRGAQAQRLALKIDRERNRLANLKSKNDGLSENAKLLLVELTADLEQRVRYFRDYNTTMSRAQIAEMSREIDRIEQLAVAIENHYDLPAIPKVGLDDAVRNALKTP